MEKHGLISSHISHQQKGNTGDSPLGRPDAGKQSVPVVLAEPPFSRRVGSGQWPVLPNPGQKCGLTHLALFCGLLLISGCGPGESKANMTDGQLSGKLVVTGSSTVAPLAAEMARRFEMLHPEVRIDVQAGGSSRGIADARRGAADIGMISRDLKNNERDMRVFPIARDGVCVILHKDNPIDSLTDAQIVAIYTDEINNWKEVGGRDAPITVVNKAAGRATLEVFLNYFEIDERQIQADVVVGHNEQGIKTVAGNPHAVAYVSIGTAEADVENGVAIKLLPIQGVPASTWLVADGSFPLSRPLNLVTRESPAGIAKQFIEFAQSEKIHEVIRAQFFTPVSH